MVGNEEKHALLVARVTVGIEIGGEVDEQQPQ